MVVIGWAIGAVTTLVAVWLGMALERVRRAATRRVNW